MKKILFFLTIMALVLFGCSRTEFDSVNTPKEVEDHTSKYNATIDHSPSGELFKRSEGLEHRPQSYAELSNLPEYYPQWYGDVKSEFGTVYSVTVKDYREAEDYSEIIYHKEQLDFSELKISALSFNPDSKTEALRMSVTMPISWSDAVKKWFVREGLHFNFFTDGIHINAFCERTNHSVNENTFEIVYQKCIMDKNDLSYDSLEIVPYVKEFNITQYQKDEKKFDIMQDCDDVIVVNSRLINEHEEKRYTMRHDLSFIKISIPLNLSNEKKAAYWEKLIVNVEDFDYSESLGLLDPAFEYHDDPSLSTRGMIYVRKKDFNQIRIILDSIHFWKDELEICFSCYLPNDWSDAECRICETMYFDLVFDNIPPNWNKSGRDFNSLANKTIWDILPNIRFEEEKNHFGVPFWDSWNWRERHYIYRLVFPSESELQLLKDESFLTILPSILSTDDDVSEKGWAYMNGSDDEFYSRTYMKWLPDIAVTVDITANLFDSGF